MGGESGAGKASQRPDLTTSKPRQILRVPSSNIPARPTDRAGQDDPAWRTAAHDPRGEARLPDHPRGGRRGNGRACPPRACSSAGAITPLPRPAPARRSTSSAAMPRSIYLISDIVMPEIYGTDLIRQAHALRPGLPALLISGLCRPAERAAWSDPGGCALPRQAVRSGGPPGPGSGAPCRLNGGPPLDRLRAIAYDIS